MKFSYGRSGSGPLIPFLVSSSHQHHHGVLRRRDSRDNTSGSSSNTCFRFCQWVTILTLMGWVGLLLVSTTTTTTPEETGAAVAPGGSHYSDHDRHMLSAASASARAIFGRSRKGFLSSQQIAHHDRWLSHKKQDFSSQKCTEDIQGLIEQQKLDWTQKRTLPKFKPVANKGGGVIVFWHNAKTGGTTVRKQCASLPGVDYMLLLKPEDYYGGGQLISERLTPYGQGQGQGTTSSNSTSTNNNQQQRRRSKRNPNNTLFVEMHGMNSPTVLDMESHLQKWRDLSQRYGTPLFVFTLLREPVAYSLSYFNFFHQHVVHMPSQQELRQSSFNRQCHTLAASPGHNKRICALLYKKFYHLFDWVGTTEKMTQETLPLLQHLLRFKPAQRRFAPSSNTNTTATTGTSSSKTMTGYSGGPSFMLPSDTKRDHYNVAIPHNYSLHYDSLSQQTIQTLKERTCLDRGLWERAQQDYKLSMWEEQITGRPH